MTTEAGLRGRILAAVRQQWPRRVGVLLRGNPASAATGPGHPDIDGVVRSRPIALEIKKARGKPTPLQEMRLRDLRDVGCYAWIVRSPEEACDAVYWVAKGWTRPLSNEPLDLNQWLMNDPPKVEAQPWPEEQALSGEADLIPEPHTPTTVPMPTELWDTPEHQETAAHALGFESAAQREAVSPTPGTVQHDIKRLDADLRTVGDRVTLIYERVDTFTAVLFGIDRKLTQLLGMIMEDPGAEFAEESGIVFDSNGAAENPTVFGSAPTPTVPEAAPPKRKRRSRAEMEAARAAEQAKPDDFAL